MINILYIAGAGRSGSTLLERILGQLDGVVNVGELRHAWHRSPNAQRCDCGEILGECVYWQEVMAQAGFPLTAASFVNLYAAQRKVDRIRYIPGMLNKSLAGNEFAHNHAIYAGTLRNIYSAIHVLTGSHTIVDASKDMSTLYLLREMGDVRLRVLHLVRDSRAVAYSWTREKVRTNLVGETAYMDKYSPQRSALDWIYRNRMTEMVRGRADGYIRLHYEELIADPLEVVGRIARFIGLPEPDLSFIQGGEIDFPKESHALAGNPVRFQRGSVQLRMDSAWKQEFRKSDKAIVTALTWPMLRRYNYL